MMIKPYYNFYRTIAYNSYENPNASPRGYKNPYMARSAPAHWDYQLDKFFKVVFYKNMWCLHFEKYTKKCTFRMFMMIFRNYFLLNVTWKDVIVVSRIFYGSVKKYISYVQHMYIYHTNHTNVIFGFWENDSCYYI